MLITETQNYRCVAGERKSRTTVTIYKRTKDDFDQEYWRKVFWTDNHAEEPGKVEIL